MWSFREWLDNVRYDHPGLYGVLLVSVGTMTVFVCFMLLPESPLLKAMGVSGLQTRISATTNGLYWSTRATFNSAGDGEAVQVFGNVEGIDKSGKLIVSVPEGAQWIRRLLTLANAEVVDLYGVAQIVGSLRTENARFEIYPTDRAVVWIRGAPLNVKLIEAGVAKPDPNPRTNIFDLAFAAYYWSIAKGNSTNQPEGEAK